MSKNKLLVVSGPTACGKTGLAIKVANMIQSVIISADSRQIYKETNIGTGKDHPENIIIKLIDIVDIDNSFSAYEYSQLAQKEIERTIEIGMLPILVGGTGLYIDFCLNDKIASPTPNKTLRNILNKFPLTIVSKIAWIVNKNDFSNLNTSDVRNKVRLIRIIEKKFFRKTKFHKGLTSDFDILFIYLSSDIKKIQERIDKRIKERIKGGLIDEIEKILNTHKWNDPGLNTLAYKEFRDFFEERSNIEECIERWRRDEYKYAKRQVTWFKKVKNKTIVDIDKKNWQINVLSKINQWYNQSNDDT